MCFSASASYCATALLEPAGLYDLTRALRKSRPYWMMAMVPLLFGIQQGVEGRLWQVIAAGDAEAVRQFALAFLFFSHFLWLFWIPLSSALVEPEGKRKTSFLVVAILGALAGAAMYLPLLFFADWLTVEVIRHSIDYKVTMFHEDYMPVGVDRSLYALIVMIPLLDSSHRHFRLFGMLVALSLLLAAALYSNALISVWCFFAAILSLYLIHMVRSLRPVQAG